MYKVVIVDDESVIVEGLTRVIPWEEYRCEVVATAHDVTQAAKIIREHRPDILFTDIQMPDGDGLTMLAGLATEHPDMQVTVLTGHRDFDYAQQAINLGVCRYLLKPSKMGELVEALESMTDKLAHQVAKEPQPQPPPPSDAAESADAAGSFLVRQAVAWIEERCSEKISLNDVAESCYVSQWHLSKLLNKYTQQTFYEILNSARIAKAKELMADPSLRIRDIAEMVGYIDTPHFSRIFKKQEGISANEYRNAHIK